MNTDWNPPSDSKIILEQSSSKTARYLGAALMGLVALSFAYFTITGFQNGRALGYTFGEAFVSVLINFLITLVLALGAALLILMRARIVFDPQAEEIQAVRDFRITQRADKHTFRDVVSVQVKDESKRAKEKTPPNYAVNLLLKNRQVISLASALDALQARELSERIAKLLKVKVENLNPLQENAAAEKEL